MPLSPESELTELYGVSNTRAKLFEKLDLHTVDDLVRHYPRGYENRGNVKKACELTLGETASVILTVDGSVKSTRIPSRGGRTLTVQKLTAYDDTGSVGITFFNRDYLKQTLSNRRTFRFYGKVTGGFLTPQLTSPEFEPAEITDNLDNLVPIYPLTAGITRNMLSKLIKRALTLYESIETLSEEILAEYDLIPLHKALKDIHFPENVSDAEKARKRLAFEELLDFQIRLRTLKKRNRIGRARLFSCHDMTEFFESLPFELTSAQKRTLDEIIYDMTRASAVEGSIPSNLPNFTDSSNQSDKSLSAEHSAETEPMRRLIQGDVGSGKTIIAAAAVYVCVKNSCQAALMAPTEILAEQHYQTFLPIAERHHIVTALLTGSTKASEKKKILSALADGKIDFIIGTHSLLEDNVVFKAPGLTVTDEQHRFGVVQRNKLSSKSGNDSFVPHMLVMSATPIPRTLAMILYGDLDISIMDELPPGRQRVDTFAVGEEMRQRIYAFTERLISEGRQCYIVCPLAEKPENEYDDEMYKEELKAARDYCDTLSKDVFPNRSVDFVHGKMKPCDKEAAMRRFSDGKTDILVSTTVIEVGVNVPNAALMIVENAERFGLSQLHQLRGRVGRGQHKSYCVLISPFIEGKLASGKNDAEKRLKILCDNESGFKIAEYDLKLRGPGDFFGYRQHGELSFKIADLAADMTLIEQTKKLADKLCRKNIGE